MAADTRLAEYMRHCSRVFAVITITPYSNKTLEPGPSAFQLEHADNLGTCRHCENTQTPRGQADHQEEFSNQEGARHG